MDIITGYTGEKHVTSEQDRDINIGICGRESYVLQTGTRMEAEVSSNNEIKIRDGVIIHQGCAASIKKNTYDPITIMNGSQGMKRIDLIVARYERNNDTGIESMNLIALQGTPEETNPAVPEYVSGDIQAGDAVADMPMYQVIIDGLNITEVKKVCKEVGNLAQMKNEIDELNRKRCYSSDEIDTGKTWINGEKVYRKCFVLTSTGTFAHGISSLDKVLGIDATYYQTGTYGYANCANYITFQKSNIYTSFPSSGITASSSNPIYITVEYTKS